MSADNGLTLERHTEKDKAYSLRYWQGDSRGRVIFESNDIFTILARAEEESVDTEYNVSLRGFTDD